MKQSIVQMQDIRIEPNDGLEILTNETTMWVNVDGRCVFRMVCEGGLPKITKA